MSGPTSGRTRAGALLKGRAAGAAGALCLALGGAGQMVWAGAFVADEVTHPIGYTGAATVADIKVCIASSVAPATAASMERPVRVALARVNALTPTTANVRPRFLATNRIDFESVLVHELGHCNGLAHANQDDGPRPQINSTHSDAGPNGEFEYGAGADGVHGSADDVRGDDRNLYFFRRLVNDPFSMPEVVDSSTYSTDLADLPVGQGFAANAERSVAALAGVPNTEAVMQHDIVFGETARTLAHDDVSAWRYARSGLDEVQGTGDDYRTRLVYGGVSDAGDCDIRIETDANAGLAYCSYGLRTDAGTDHWRITSGRIVFDTDIDFVYDTRAPCSGSRSLPAGAWVQVSLPCEVGLAGGGTLADVFGDDLDMNAYQGAGGASPTWAVYAHEYALDGAGDSVGAYRPVAPDEVLRGGVAYWMIALDENVSIDVEGDYHSQLDAPLDVGSRSGSGWNLVGNPFRAPSPWSAARVIDVDGAALSPAEADPGGTSVGSTACTGAGGPATTCRAARFAYRWNPASGAYEILDASAGVLAPMEGAWVFAARDDIELRVGMPAGERDAR